MRSIKRIAIVLCLLTLCLALMAVSAFAAEKVASGTCGPKIQWVLDKEGTLTISGSGPMEKEDDPSLSWGRYSDDIRRVVIEPGVTTIVQFAFNRCAYLVSVEIPDTVTAIEVYAFSECYNLRSITIPDSVNIIGDFAFYACGYIDNIKLPDSLSYWGSRTFAMCNGLRSVELPKTVTSIPSGAFGGTSISSVTIPKGVKSIGTIAFSACYNLDAIYIPRSVTSIEKSAFFDCTDLKYVFYEGSKDEWDKIAIDDKNSYLTGATIHYNATGLTLDTPRITKLQNVTNGIAINWKWVPGATNYKLVVKTGDSGWTTIGYSQYNYYLWEGATSGVTYTFGIRCVTADGKTYTSGFDSSGKTITYVARPTIKKVQNIQKGIWIKWDPIPGAAKYKLVVKEEGGSWKTIWNTVNTSYTWTGGESGKTYTFAIRCTTADGKSYTSAFDSTGKTIQRISQPWIDGMNCTKNGIHISWVAVPGAVKYKLLLKTDTGWKTLWNTSKRNYVWTGAESGKTYTFTVVCTTADGKTYTSSFDSTGKSIKYVANPVITSVESTADGIKISWDPSPGAERYQIVMYTGNSWCTLWNTVKTSFVWTGAQEGKTYTFSIRCANADSTEIITGIATPFWTHTYTPPKEDIEDIYGGDNADDGWGEIV